MPPLVLVVLLGGVVTDLSIVVVILLEIDTAAVEGDEVME
jgi:hypothetical protein